MGTTVMLGWNSLGATALLAALNVTMANLTMAGAGETDLSKYPDIRAQWNRIGSAQFDPSKGGGLAQQVPFTPEYQVIFDKILADRATGGLENNWTAACLPAGMPRAMIGYEPLDFVVTPDITYIKLSYMQELRRIHTDGRDWPKQIEPTFIGYSIGKWVDEDGDGRYDVLVVETRSFKGPRTYDGTGTPFHADNQTVVKERIYLDKADRNVLHDDITVIDNALSRPWTVARKYKRESEPVYSEYVCGEGNQQIMIGKENYMVSADGYLMPTKKGQEPPDLRNFEPASQ
jgi:hypothetical protein